VKPRLLLVGSLLAAVGCGPVRTDTTTPAPPRWHQQESGTEASFRGLSVVSTDVAWASGTGGTVVRTTDGGTTWVSLSVDGAEGLDFRDVEAFSESTAYLLAAGEGDKSRIYKTTDGGKNWALQFTCTDPKGFYDAIAFWDETHGIAFGDPQDGKFQLLATDDGMNWKPLPTDGLPDALPGEGAFAASGTCLVTSGVRDAWFVTGGKAKARVFHSTDRGKSWTASETPVAAGMESAGIFSIAFRDADHGMTVGGDYKSPNSTGATAAVTADGGKTWALTGQSLPFRSAVAWTGTAWVAVGTSGSHLSADDGATWIELDGESYNAVAFTPAGVGWAVGPKGRVAKFGK
jgi:photosystem II stability/assembly factor-like uncharacterized protein